MLQHETEVLYKHFLECNGLVCTDTRKIVKNSVFFALRGPSFNANELATEALEKGCSFAVIDDPEFKVNDRQIMVNDVLKALQDLARHHRRQFDVPVLAITGSNAKTTHKELIGAVMSTAFNTLITEGNLNNHIGVPLTLLRLRKEHGFAVIEMGANHQKEIAALCGIAEPGFGLITNIGKAHLEGFGGVEGVKAGKGELFQFLGDHKGLAFVNGDDPVLTEMSARLNKYTYGCTRLFDIIGKDQSSPEAVSFSYTTRYGGGDWSKAEKISTGIPGAYNFINCLAAVAVGTYFKVEKEKIKEALESFVMGMNRSQLVKTKSNTVLLDAYNANPNSMKAAIENFAKYPAEKKMLLLGDMFELGDSGEAEHQYLTDLLKQHGLSNAVLVGKDFCRTTGHNYKIFGTAGEALSHLKNEVPSGFTILIKGSRAMKMEALLEAL